MSSDRNKDKRELPEKWTWSTLGNICTKPQYGYTTSASDLPVGPRFLRITDLSSGHVDWSTVPYCADQPENVDKYLLKKDDLLVARAGSVGKAYRVTNPPEAIFASYLIRFRAVDVYPRYIEYFLQSPGYWDQIQESRTGITIPNVNASKLSAIDLPVAPLEEQHRIAGEIEKQFTRLDAGTANLKRVQANLERYKASVLKAACEGRLVPQDPSEEPAERLLARILAERRHMWEEQEWQKLVEKAKKNAAQASRKLAGRPARLSDLAPEEWQDLPEEVYGKYLPKNEKWKEKYKEPEQLDTSKLQELPAGWVQVPVGRLLLEIQTGPFGSSLHRSDYVEDGIPVVNPASINGGRIEPIDGMSIDEETRSRLSNFKLYECDVILGRRGEMGRAAVVTSREAGWLCGTGSLILRFGSGISRQFIVFLFASEMIKSYLGNASVGTTMQNLNQTILKNMTIPLPPSREQQRIVDEIERSWSVVASAQDDISVNLARCERLRQTILEQAFSGRLVSQDPGS